MLQGNGNSVDLQTVYDESYLTCTKAVFYESQGNEDEAMRSWRAALGVISGSHDVEGSRTHTPQSETESALVDSLRQLELQCKERIDLLEALRLSRQEDGLVQNASLPSIAEPKSVDASSPGWIGDGTIPAVTYTQLARPDLPPRPPLRPRTSSRQSAGGGSTPGLHGDADSPEPSRLRPTAGSTTQTGVSRSPSPDKHTLRTTLRTGRLGERLTKPKRRTDSKPVSDGPGASKAAALAWSALGFRDRSSRGQGAVQSTSTLPTFSIPPREERGAREPGPSRMQWDSHTRRLVTTRENEADVTPGSRSSLESTGNPRPSREYSSPSPSLLSVNAAASALVSNLSAESTQAAPGRAGRAHVPRLRTAPPPEQPRRTPPAKVDHGASRQDDGGTSGRSSSTSDLPSRRKPARDGSGSITRFARKEVPISSDTGSFLDGNTSPVTGQTRNAFHAKRKIREENIEGDTLQVSTDSEISDSGEVAAKTAEWTQKGLLATLRSLPPGIDKDAARQILNEIVVHGDEVHWSDVAGLEIAKAALREAVVYPFLRPDLFMGLREPARGMLLFGPPGTGKTMLARAVATESKSTFFSISASSLTSKYLGESEKLVRALFSLARLLAPSIIFVDEIDSLLSQRSSSGEHEATRRLKTEFLIQWSDLQRAAAGRDSSDKEKGDPNRVLVLAATNLPWAIDEAARRRFVRRQYIPLPESETRQIQLRTLLGQQKHSLTEEDIERLVDLTDGFSGSDITALAKDAAMGPLRSLGEALLHMTMDEIRPIAFQDFESSLRTIRPSVNKSGLREYEDWAKEFGERGG